MRPQQLNFNEALAYALDAAAAASADRLIVSVIRDVLGRLTFLVHSKRGEASIEQLGGLSEAQSELGLYSSKQGILYLDDLYSPETILNDPTWQEVEIGGKGAKVRLLERQISGEDWALGKIASRSCKRMTFFSVKGGVGRSSALTITARALAALGKKVLLIDLDLESPGLSSLLLPNDRAPENGIVDWLIEDVLGHTPSVETCVTYSPLTDFVPGSIRVATAAGLQDSSYLAKLSRVCSDGFSTKTPLRLADRLEKMIVAFEEQEKPDVTLIDSRGGLHDVAAIAINRLSDVTLLFFTDSEQNWSGYRHLFEYWKQRPKVLRDVRDRVKVVLAFMADGERQHRFAAFRHKAWDLFRETLYDEIPAGVDELNEDFFSFDEADTEAPHNPLFIRWSSRFLDFDPRVTAENGGVSDAEIASVYGPFLAGLKEIPQLEGLWTSQLK